VNRRDFIRTAAFGSAFAAVPEIFAGQERPLGELIVPKNQGLRITGTFLDEISHDIPHQNWGAKEWDADFAHMKAIGIDTVIMIRCGHRKFITYPSAYLMRTRGCYKPSVDLLELYLSLADKYGMDFWFGLYDPGAENPLTHYADVNDFVIEEVWKAYSHHKSFRGWYVSSEFSRTCPGCVEAVRRMGLRCKSVSGNLPTFISPWIDGKKAVNAYKETISRAKGVSVSDHEREWTEILSGVKGAIDICAFQDGHIDYDELDDFFLANKRMADKFGMKCWTNAESLDRDMPIRFLPIKFDKLRLKLEAAKRCGYDKAITFEFSHFMSPQSMYPSAGHLYDRYCEYFGD